MANVERSQNTGNGNVIETLALFLAKKITREDMGKNSRTVLDFYLGLMSEDPEFASQVNARKNQLLSKEGYKIPLFSEDEIKQMKKHRSHRKKSSPAGHQLRFWQEKTESNTTTYRYESILDPEYKLSKYTRETDYLYRPNLDSLISDETHEKRMKLRDLIGLPVASGKDPHVNDKFYQFLVRRISTYDTFGIFIEFDRVLDEIPEDLNLKIKQVGGLVDKLLNKNLDRSRQFSTYNRFVHEYRERWGFPE